MSATIVAILHWRPASTLKDNRHLVQKAGGPRSRKGAAGPPASRTLIVRADGSAEAHRFSVEATALRLGGTILRRTAGKMRNAQRG